MRSTPAHYKNKLTEASETSEQTYSTLFGSCVDRIAHHFGTHTSLLFVPPGSEPNIDRARSFFERIDPLMQRIVVVRDEKVQIAWQRRMPQTSPNIGVIKTNRRTTK